MPRWAPETLHSGRWPGAHYSNAGCRCIDQTTKRRLLAGAALLVLVGLGAEVTASRIVDRGFVRDRLAGELGDDDVRVDVGKVSFSLFGRRMKATDVVVTRIGRATLFVPRVVASGVPVLPGGEAPGIGQLTFDRPMLYIHPQPGSGRDENDGRGEGRQPGTPVLRIGRLRVTGGTVLVWRPGATRGPGHVLVRELELDGRDVALDGQGRITGAPGSLTWSTGEFSRTRADGLTRLTVDSTRVSAADSSFLISGLHLAPTSSDADFFDRLEEREDRIRATATRVRGRGFDVDAWIRRDVRIRVIELDTVDVDVLSNKRLPAGSGEPWLPTGLIRAFGGSLDLDTIRVSGRIAYSEIPQRRAVEAAHIGFENFDGQITGLSNAPEAPPILIDASMTLFEAPASIRIEIPYDSSTYRMETSGRVGALDLTRINSITVPLQGIEVQNGRLAAMRFDVTVDGRTAGGTVWAAYRNLDVQMVDRETGEGGLFDDIKSFVTNTFVLRGSNMPRAGDQDGSRPGTVEYYVERDDSFFTRIWAPIRSGLMAVARS